MDNIKILEEIGLKKISDETHIEQKYLKYMVDCDFEKLNRINTLGFVKILSRAYSVDLTSWTEAFEEYWSETHKDDEDKRLFMIVDDKPKSSKLFIFVFLFIVIVAAAFFFVVLQEKIDLDDYINQEETNFEQSKIVEDTQKTLDEINSSIVKSEALAEEVIEDVNDTEILEIVNEDNVTNIEVVEETVKEEDVDEVEEVIDNQQIQEDTQEEIAEETVLKFEQEAVFSPNIKLWIGLVYLDNKKRRSYLGEGNFSIDTSRDQIITTGHGSFDITQNGETKKFTKQAPMRFLVKDSNITEITFSEFKELNEGKTW